MLQIKLFRFNHFGENTYLLYSNDGDCFVIDPGNSTPAEDEKLFSFIDGNGLTPKLIINTHAHVDHIVGNAALAKRYNIEVAAHTDTAVDFAVAENVIGMYGFDRSINIKKADRILEDGETLPLGDGQVEVIATPGHAKGSISLYVPTECVVFTGDALFCRSIGRTDLPGGNYEELRTSIRERLFTLPDETMVMPGHDEATSIGEEKDFNPYVAV